MTQLVLGLSVSVSRLQREVISSLSVYHDKTLPSDEQQLKICRDPSISPTEMKLLC